MKTWQGRISAPSNPLFERFSSSVDDDRVLAPYDIRVSRAHVAALALAGIISHEEADRLNKALGEVEREIAKDRFVWRDDLEDVHTHVEVALRDRVGALADSIHAGRSRNEQVAADLRLYTLDQTAEVLQRIVDLQETLLQQASRNAASPMPGYTHLQQAQPVTIGFAITASVAMLDRDWERFEGSLARVGRSPLGCAALAGSSLPLDRDLLASLAGLGQPSENALDAVGDRDFIVEFIAAAALCMVHLSRLSEDFIFWSSTELGFVVLPDAFASGSSMMPQKKNPDVFELVRGKAAIVQGALAGSLALLKGLPGGYDRDLQESKPLLFLSARTLISCLEVLCATVQEVRFDGQRSAAAISGFSVATDLAEHLVVQGVPFRQAHETVAGIVRACVEEGRTLEELRDDEKVELRLDGTGRPPTAEDSIRAKRTSGSTNVEDVQRQIRAFERRGAAHRRRLEQLR